MTIEPKLDSVKYSFSSYIKQTQQGFIELTKSNFMRKLSLFYIGVGGITWVCLSYFAQPFALEFNYSERQMSLVFGFIYLITTLTLYLITKNNSFLSRTKAFIGFPLVMTASFLPVFLLKPITAPLAILGVQIAGSGRFAILDRYVNDEFESKNRSTAISTMNMLIEFLVMILIQASSFINSSRPISHVYISMGALTLILLLPLGFSLSRSHRKISRTNAAVL